MKSRILLGGTLLGLLVGLGGAWALQEKGGMTMGRAPKDAYLDRLAGDWEWTGTMHAGGQTIQFIGEEKVEWVCNEQFLLSRMKQIPAGGMPPFEFMTVVRADPGTKSYKQWIFEGMGMTATGKGKREGDTLTYEGKSEMGRSRTTFEITGDGEATSVTEAQYPGQEEWVPFMKMEGKKKAP